MPASFYMMSHLCLYLTAFLYVSDSFKVVFIDRITQRAVTERFVNNKLERIRKEGTVAYPEVL
jgi:hypothetical protein